jgi:hypothetical protein
MKPSGSWIWSRERKPSLHSIRPQTPRPSGRPTALRLRSGPIVAARGESTAKAANGAGREELIAKMDREPDLTDWSYDWRFLLYHAPDEKTRWDEWALPLEGDRKPFPVFRTRLTK